MVSILIDHNIEGQAMLLWGTLFAEGWPKLFPIEMLIFDQVGLSENCSDKEIWHFAQKHKMILLTANRRMNEEDSLEGTIRKYNTTTSLPVLTIGNPDRIMEKPYRETCAMRILEICLDLENFVGTGRIFIP